jgi:hypothetical protein
MANSCRCSAVSELRGFLGSVSVFQLPGIEFGAALAAELAGELDAVFGEVFGFLAVSLGAEVGVEDEGLGVLGFGRTASPRD